jgi:hypothetical protein
MNRRIKVAIVLCSLITTWVGLFAAQKAEATIIIPKNQLDAEISSVEELVLYPKEIKRELEDAISEGHIFIMVDGTPIIVIQNDLDETVVLKVLTKK